MKLKNISRAEQLERLRRRYEGRGPGGKSRILDELCEQYGYHRKHAIRLLNGVAVFLSIDNRLRPNPNAGMKSLSTALVLFLACLSLRAQEHLSRPECLKYTFFLALDLKEMLGTPIPTDPDLKRPVAFRLGDRGALLLPESKLTEQALKSSGEIVAVGQLWLVKIAPLVEGQVVASSKLKLLEVKAEAGQATAACFALAVSRNADKALELLVYGKEKEPLAKVPLKIVAGQANPETPLDLSAERNDDRGQLTLTLLGKFQANLPVGPAEF